MKHWRQLILGFAIFCAVPFLVGHFVGNQSKNGKEPVLSKTRLPDPRSPTQENLGELPHCPGHTYQVIESVDKKALSITASAPLSQNSHPQ